MQEFQPDSGQLSQQTYCFPDERVGVGGFFVAFPNLGLPLFLKGERSEYRFFTGSNAALICILHIYYSVCLVDPERRAYSIVFGGFSELLDQDDELIFFDPDYPIVGLTPDRTRLSFRRRVLERDIGKLSSTPEYEEVQMVPLLTATV